MEQHRKGTLSVKAGVRGVAMSTAVAAALALGGGRQ